MRSRVIYCQSWYSRTDNVHWCRNKRATAGVVGISQNEVGPAAVARNEGPWRRNRDYDLSNRFARRLCLCRTADKGRVRRDGAEWGSTKTQPK